MLVEEYWDDVEKTHYRKFNLSLSKYDAYVLEQEIFIRISQIEGTRDKCGISAEDKDAEPNKHIESLLKVSEQLGFSHPKRSI